jgi:signal transduction histidine kinase
LIKENQLKSQQINNQKIFSFVSVLILAGAIFFTIIQIRNRKQISLLNKNLLIRKNELEIANSTLLENNKLLIAQQTKLKELNDSKDKFISILGHDLKSPFSGILGVFDYLVQEWHKTDNNTKYRMITAAQQSALSTFELLEELLYWGKSQQGLIVLQPSNIKASDLIGEVVDLYQNSSEKKSQRMEVNIEPDMQLNTDMRLLKQVIQNFVGNAIKFTHHHGIIRIEGKTGNEKVCISVTDSGIGIPADTIDKLFDLNSNYGRPGTDKEKSTGMGLILCHEYARIMGATLEVSSTEGKGSTFSICFPKHSDKTDL